MGAARRSAWAGALVPLCLWTALPVQAQRPTDPPDTFRDPAARALILLAREARERDVRGIRSYEGTLRQRIYVGLDALRFRRERGLFEMERVARIRWSEDGAHAIHWLGARTAIPIAGIDTGRPGRGTVSVSVSDSAGGIAAGLTAGDSTDAAELEEEMARDMLDETEVPGFNLRPGGDRLVFGDDDWALHPLADSAGAHYRFASGDTLRIDLPDPNPDVVLYEIRVEPRRAEFNLVAGSLWFDSETHSLVRATYKPARPFDLSLDDPGEDDDIPAFLQPVEAEVSYITVEYSFHEFEYWLPRRFAFDGEARLGKLVRIPILLEWSIGDYSVNEPTGIPIEGELPAGWRRQVNVEKDDEGNDVFVTVVVPTAAELREYPLLSEDFGTRAPASFSNEEIAELRSELRDLIPTDRRFRPRFVWGLRHDLLRYNRVEGLSVGLATNVPLSPTAELEGVARIGTGDRTPGGTLSLHLGEENERWTLAGYHRLESMGDWSAPFALTASVGNLFFGSDHGQYVRTTGISLSRERQGRSTRLRAGLSHERQRSVALETDFYLLRSVFGDTLDTVIPASDLTLTGLSADVRWFSGTDPNALVVTARALAEAVVGDAEYQRAALTLSASHPLPLGLSGALEAGAGALLGDEPAQSRFFLGGAQTLRGFHDNEVSGAAFWRGRAELATGFAGARLALFGDAGWAGPRTAFTLDDPILAVGLGASLLDGLFRFDVARGVRRGTGWSVHAYFDGLF